MTREPDSAPVRMRVVEDVPRERLVLEAVRVGTLRRRVRSWVGRFVVVPPPVVSEADLSLVRLEVTHDGVALDVDEGWGRRVRIDAETWRTLRVRVVADGDGEHTVRLTAITAHPDGFADLRASLRVVGLDTRGDGEDFAIRIGHAAGLSRFRVVEHAGAWTFELYPETSEGYRKRGADLLALPPVDAVADYMPTSPAMPLRVEPQQRFHLSHMPAAARKGDFVISLWGADHIELARDGDFFRATWGVRIMDEIIAWSHGFYVSLFGVGIPYAMLAFLAAPLCMDVGVVLMHGLLPVIGLATVIVRTRVVREGRMPLRRRVAIACAERRVTIEEADGDPRVVPFDDATAVTLDVGSAVVRVVLLLSGDEELLFERRVAAGAEDELVTAVHRMARDLADRMRLPLHD